MASRLRVAVFNIKELSTPLLKAADAAGVGLDPRVMAAARIIQRVRPDVLLICEIDHDYTKPGLPLETNALRFQKHYLLQGDTPIEYPHIFAAPNNTGILSGIDLDGDGVVATPEHEGTLEFANDSWGWGIYPGQFSMVIYSRHPIDAAGVRTFQRLLWKDLPGHHIPPDHYQPESLEVFRLSSKSHWDVPIMVDGRRIHLLACHPTPQGFDGPEDRNGRRNFDELRLWKLYLDGEPALVDDAGRAGGLPPGEPAVVLGDLNSDPCNGSRYDGVMAIDQLLRHPRLQDTGPIAVSEGSVVDRPAGPPRYPERHTIGEDRTARFDYVLPTTDLTVLGGGIFWPDPRKDLPGAIMALAASDHRLLWVDLEV